MTELSRGEIVATLMGRELSKRLARAHKRITETQSRTASELSAIRAVEDSYARSIDAVRESVGALSAADASLTRTAEEQRALLGLTTDAMAEIDARLRANEATDQAQDTQLGLLDLRVTDVEALAPVPGPKGDKGDKGDPGPPGRPGRSSVGGGAGQATTILSGGTAVGTRGTLNFVSGATVTDDAANQRVNITVSGGGGNVNSVSVSSGLSITGTSDLTITNTGVRSLAGSGISVSSSTGAVTITAPSVTAGTGIAVAGSGTTALTVSATGVNSVTAGSGINVSGTTALTVSSTGVQSLTAGNGISVSGTTTPTVSASLAAGTGIGISGTTTLSVSNTGVTSIVAGTNVSVSGATGAVTVNAPAFATPGSSAVGDSAAAGTATTVARSDHTHGREAFATPGASAVADTASAGSATTVARSDHRHSREAFGTTIIASTIGGTAAAGTSTGVAREDHKHAFPAGAAPSALTVSSTQATGTSASPALADHVHAMPGSAIAGASAVGDTAATGTATTVALSDHRHSREAFGTPVVVNGQTTSLATGSLTTLARADHVHTMSNVPVLLASTTLGSAASSVTFSSFSSAYKHLMILFMARSSATTGAYDTLAYQFNGDTAANYRSIANTTATTHASVAIIPNTTTFFPTQPGIGRTTIFYYNDTSSGFQKRTFTDTDSDIGTSATSPFTTVWGGTWTTVNTAITSVLMKTSNGNFVAGSRFDLYGLP